MELQNNTNSVFQMSALYIQKEVLRKNMEKEGNRINIGVKPGKLCFGL